MDGGKGNDKDDKVISYQECMHTLPQTNKHLSSSSSTTPSRSSKQINNQYKDTTMNELMTKPLMEP